MPPDQVIGTYQFLKPVYFLEHFIFVESMKLERASVKIVFSNGTLMLCFLRLETCVECELSHTKIMFDT